MFAKAFGAALFAVVALWPLQAIAQDAITVLDEAQDTAAEVDATSPCGTQPVTIARMQWPSAAILAEIHARLLATHFGCETRVMPGDMATTGSSMATAG